MSAHESPLPLEGEGVGGWGGPAGLDDKAREARAEPFEATRKQPANTPSQPSPLEGEGYRKRPRIRPGGIERGRALRAEPTYSEGGLWKRLRRFPVRFRRQAPIGPYIVDFACHRARLVIEVDGGIHDRPDVAARDLKRQEWLVAEGYRVVRFTNRQVDDHPDEVCAAINAQLPPAFRMQE